MWSGDFEFVITFAKYSNFAKFAFARINFCKYFAKQLILTESPDHVLQSCIHGLWLVGACIHGDIWVVGVRCAIQKLSVCVCVGGGGGCLDPPFIL